MIRSLDLVQESCLREGNLDCLLNILLQLIISGRVSGSLFKMEAKHRGLGGYTVLSIALHNMSPRAVVNIYACGILENRPPMAAVPSKSNGGSSTTLNVGLWRSGNVQ